MELQRYLRPLLLTGLYIIPFVGIIVWTDFFFPFITGKNFAFRILVELVFGLWAILAIAVPEYRPKWSPTYLAGLLFLATMAISTVFAENPLKAFWSNFERMEGYISLLHFGAYLLVLTSVLRTQEAWRKYISTSIIASSLVALYGLVQAAGWLTINQGGVRIDGTLGNATYMAVYMMFNGFLALYLLATGVKNKTYQYLLWLAVVVEFLLVILTATRGTILALFGGLFLTGIIASLVTTGVHKKIGIAIIGAVLVLGALFFAVKDTAYVQSHPILSRIATISINAGFSRFEIWTMALKGVEERPIFGWGQEGFNYLFNKYYSANMYAQEPWFDRAHSVALDWLVAGGVFALALYLSFYVLIVWYLWRPKSAFSGSEKAVLTGLLAAYAFHNIFVFDNLMSYLMFLILIGFVTVRSYPPHAWGEHTERAVMQYVTPVGAAATLAVVYLLNIPGIASASDLIQGILPMGNVSENIRYFKNAAARTGIGTQEVAEQYTQFAIQVAGNQSVPEQIRIDLVESALQRLDKEIKRAPNDARLHLFRGAYLKSLGQYDAALVSYGRALELSPQKQGIKFEIATVYLAQQKLSEARTVAKEAFESAPEYEQARVFYAMTLILNNDISANDKILLEHFKTVTPDDPLIYTAYKQAGMNARVIEILKKRIEKNPYDEGSKSELESLQR